MTIILLALISAFIFVFGVFIFNKIFIENNANYLNNAVGAFMGAFFAFLFIRIGEVLTKLYERKNKHYNALVGLERACNEYLNIISDNIFVINDFITISKSALGKNQPFVYFNELHELSVDKEITLNLANIDLINETFSFEVGIDKMNNSIRATNRFYSDIKGAFIQRNIDFETYKANVLILMGKLEELKSFLLSLQEEDKKICAIARILMKDRPLIIRLINLLVKNKITHDMETGIPDEIKKLEKEIAITQEKSKEKINQILNNGTDLK